MPFLKNDGYSAEIALAFATGGGSVLLQIVKWLATTLPQLLRTAGSVMNFVETIKSIKLKDVLKLLSAAGIAGFLTKGLFGELTGLPKESKDEKGEKEPASGRAEKGLVKVLHALSSVFNVSKGVYNKIAGGVGKILGVINIAAKPWFATFSAIYAGAVKAMDVVGNPVETLSEGAGKLKEAVGGFFGSVKGKLKEIAGSIKSKVAILGQPAQLMKTIANKAVDMVLNFIISHPPSALIKAVFKGIEAIAGKSIVELVRQYIPFADKLFDKIAGSGPVQSLMKPLQGPINNVNGMIDEVTDGATGMVNNAEKSATSTLGSGAKLVTAMGIGKSGGNKANSKGDAKGESKGGGPKGGGDFLGILLSGIHTKLYAIGLRNIAKLGKNLASKVAGGAKTLIGKMLTKKVKFKLGNESHELWVEKGKNKNVVMMASTPDLLENKIKEGEVPDNGEIREKETTVNKNPTEKNAEALGEAVQKAKGVRKVNFGKYLKDLIGDSPKDMVDPHAHHILFKEGHGSAQKALVKEGQKLLRRYNIDPIMGKENLIWAPNRVKDQHGFEALKNVVENLKSIEDMGGSSERIRKNLVKKLKELGDLAARRR